MRQRRKSGQQIKVNIGKFKIWKATTALVYVTAHETIIGISDFLLSLPVP